MHHTELLKMDTDWRKTE